MESSNKKDLRLASPLPKYDENTTDALVSAMRRVLNSGAYTDTTIAATGKKYKVHRMVMCSQSLFFEKAFNGNFKVCVTPHQNSDWLLTN